MARVIAGRSHQCSLGPTEEYYVQRSQNNRISISQKTTLEVTLVVIGLISLVIAQNLDRPNVPQKRHFPSSTSHMMEDHRSLTKNMVDGALGLDGEVWQAK